MDKRKCAVFTIVKNENVFLPVWIAHYSKYFDPSDIYVLDHQSNDGSTTNLDVNVIRVDNEFAFDHEWLRSTVEKFQKDLLNKYIAVLFAEGDELVYSVEIPFHETLDLFINNENCQYLTCEGYEVIQEIKSEKPLAVGEPIFPNRNFWYHSKAYCKTLLSKIPLHWCYGFHYTMPNMTDKTYPIYLCHLHKYDFEQMLYRHQERKSKWKYHSDVAEKGYSWHNALSERNDVLRLFNSTNSSPIVRIPDAHKQVLNV